MNLYEITTGYIGESYERCYAWALDEADAKRLFYEKNEDKGREVKSVRPLMADIGKSFCTKLSDCGWDDE